MTIPPARHFVTRNRRVCEMRSRFAARPRDGRL